MATEKSIGLQHIEIEKLYLDIKNPRLPSHLQDGNPKKIMEHLARTTAIDDLMDSIASHGYFDGEPLVACPNDEGQLVIVEGNRRLTALKLLHNPNEISQPSAKIIKISNEAEKKPSKIPVVVRENRKDVLPYLGFRHITGVKQWEPLAKARYLKQLFDTTSDDLEPDDRYKFVARLIGSKSHHIKRSLDALAVYNIAEDNDFFEISDLNEDSIKFSVLSTALADENIAKLTGTSKTTNEKLGAKATNPILNPDEINKDKTKKLFEWLFKKEKGGKARVAESRQIRELSKVVESPKALAAFNSGSSLSSAYRMTSGVQDDFRTTLYEAETAIINAAGMVATVKYEEEMYDLALSLNKNIKLIGSTLKDKRTRTDDDEF